MKKISVALGCTATLLVSSCGKQLAQTNGESIYRMGKNLAGQNLLDKTASRIRIVHSCRSCHGKGGERIRRAPLKFSSLTNPAFFTVPYSDSLFFRFLDHDLKSDGRKANIGVIWKMSDNDKQDLLAYLKTL